MASVTCAVRIDRPVGSVYEAWTRSRRLPTFVGGAGERRPDDAGGTDWVVMIEGRTCDFQAEVTERADRRRIAWSGAGARSHRGAVSFAELDGDASRVTVEVEWEAGEGSDLADQLLVRRRLQSELDAFGHDVVGAGERTPPEPSSTPAGPQAAAAAAPAAPAAANGRAAGTRGRGADSPTKIPAQGWLDIIKRTGTQLKADNVSIVAGGVAFYVFVALVPTLIAVISLYGLVANPVDVGRQLGPFLSALPADAADLVRSQVESITGQEGAGLGLGLVIGVVVALVGASKGMLALVAALNIAYDEQETRTFLKLRALALLLTVGLALAAVVGVGGMVAVRNLASDIGAAGEVAIAVLRWPVLALVIVFGLSALYRHAADRAAPKWRWVTPGAAAATVLWLLGSIAFSVYVRNFGSYNETYGTLGAVVVLLLWLLLSAYAVLLGAELDAEIERQTRRDSTRGRSQPLGSRGAAAADTVAPAPELAGTASR